MSGQVLSLGIPFVAGLALGAAYFGALWLTIRRMAWSARPTAWLLASTAVRLGLAVGAFYVIMDGRWERLLACLAGFIVMRTYLKRRIGPAPTPGVM
jgi:F1F0 ATPase subunit 2